MIFKSVPLRTLLRFPEKALLCLVMAAPAYQPLVAQAGRPSKTAVRSVSSLKDVLDYLSKKFGLRFSYDAALVGGYRVSFSFGDEKDRKSVV